MDIYTILSSKPHNPHYLKRYIKFIQTANTLNVPKNELEIHHICPKAIFPEFKIFSKNRWNYSALTIRQHFIAHWMLWKTFRNDSSAKAFWMMKHTRTGISINSKTYELLKDSYRSSISGANNPGFGTNGPMYGKSHTNESNNQNRISNTGKKRSREFCEQHKLRMTTFTQSDETKVKIAKSKLGIKTGPKSKLICPHCGFIGGGGAMYQHHFDNCKLLSTTMI
jgi:hypothetical protein